MIVAILFIALIAALAWSIWYGRRLVRTERTDLVFGNPAKALGGWHWVVAGVASILILWFYFSWDAARAFFPRAGNELCQVAKLDFETNPIRSVFPLDDRLLLGTELLLREQEQLDLLEEQLAAADFNDADRAELKDIIDGLRTALAMQADPEFVAPSAKAEFNELAGRIRQLSDKLADENYPGPPSAAEREEAAAQPGWGEGNTELPPLPETARGRKFDAASEEMAAIVEDFRAIRNDGPKLTARLKALEERYESFEIDQSGSPETVEQREDVVKQINRLYKRIDNGRIFPVEITEVVEEALIDLEEQSIRQQGGLWYIDAFAMPGGQIEAGNLGCSEQGSGRWLPKPSDTLATLIWMADPEVGYKGFPLLWYKMKPVSEMVGFLVPDSLAKLVPGEFPRHDDTGQVESNLKSKVYNFATGNFSSFSVPIPTGHVWDSIMRVVTGLFLGVILGVPLGLFMGLSRFAKGYFDPMIELYRPIPPLAWAPLILTIFGIHDDGKIFLLFMVAFAIMVISARTGATGTQLSKIHAAHSLGASKKQILRQVILPNSLPEILTGIRIAIGVCWGTLVAAEMLAGTTGLGFLENVARKQSDYEIIWMTILLLGLLGLIFDMIMRWVIDRAIPWRGKG